MEPTAAYAEAKDRIQAFVRGLPEADLDDRVPATPDWTVRDVVAHVTGIVVDVAAGNVAGVGTDPWTSAQVAARRGRPLEAIVAEWDEAWERLAPVMAAAPVGTQVALVGDVVVHEFDIREAHGTRTDAALLESASFGYALDNYVRRFASRVRKGGLPAVRVVAAGLREFVAGDGDPEVTVEGHPQDLFRALTGRRASEEIMTLRWDGDPGPYLDVFSTYPLPEQSQASRDR